MIDELSEALILEVLAKLCLRDLRPASTGNISLAYLGRCPSSGAGGAARGVLSEPYE